MPIPQRSPLPLFFKDHRWHITAVTIFPIPNGRFLPGFGLRSCQGIRGIATPVGAFGQRHSAPASTRWRHTSPQHPTRSAEWLELLDARHVPCAPTPSAAARLSIKRTFGRADIIGRVRSPRWSWPGAAAVSLRAARFEVNRLRLAGRPPAPAKKAHSRTVLLDLGYDDCCYRQGGQRKVDRVAV